ncbi:MAG: sigma-70 family RNA polymerase sigma factor [Planctomycetota bacterium]
MNDRTSVVVDLLRQVDGAPESIAASASLEASRLFPLVYDELRSLASRYMLRERKGHTLQPTALVHEAFLQLADQARVGWKGRTHFYAVAALAMRRVLIEHYRGNKRQKRGGGWQRISISDAAHAVMPDDLDGEELLEALKQLADESPRMARVVELKFLAGLTNEDIAKALGVTSRTVERDWRFARAWLLDRLS